MLLKHLSLQQFRNYKMANFTFTPDINVIVGPNTAGKTNLLDSIHLLSTGKSFLTDREEELIYFEQEFGRIKGSIVDKDEIELEVLLTVDTESLRAGKRFFVNGVPRRRIDFAAYLPTLFFTPLDLQIASGSPAHRRHFLDDVLEQVDKGYQESLTMYIKVLRQRNALLERAQESGYRNDKQFQYWDELLIKHGAYIHSKREEFLDFINKQKKQIFDLSVEYDHSIVSEERLAKYKIAEMGAGVTLVGPHRDDVTIKFKIQNSKLEVIKDFASRGQQRLAVLQLKMLQLKYMQKNLDQTPLLLLDDIFSELDADHIGLVWQMIGTQQIIITTTHQEFIQAKFRKHTKVIELGEVSF